MFVFIVVISFFLLSRVYERNLTAKPPSPINMSIGLPKAKQGVSEGKWHKAVIPQAVLQYYAVTRYMGV
jgi:hypothetical protein